MSRPPQGRYLGPVRTTGRSRTCGFTLIEALVCLGAVTLLASLTLSAVQEAREAARRSHCLNNIRRLAIACHAHESAHGTFPPTSCHFDGETAVMSCLSVHVRLLPFLEQSPLFSTIDLAETGAGAQSDPPESGQNPHALTAHLPGFACPSDDVSVGGTNYRSCLGIGPSAIGMGAWGNASGLFKLGRAARAAEVTDGLSNTALFSERLTGDGDPTVYTPWRDLAEADRPLHSIADAEAACPLVPREPAHHDSRLGASWLFGGFRHTWYSHAFTPNSPTPDCGSTSAVVTARSLHPGGVNLALADGSARLVGEAVDRAVWWAMASRGYGEVMGEW